MGSEPEHQKNRRGVIAQGGDIQKVFHFAAAYGSLALAAAHL
jgi:hypothetical protein